MLRTILNFVVAIILVKFVLAFLALVLLGALVVSGCGAVVAPPVVVVISHGCDPEVTPEPGPETEPKDYPQGACESAGECEQGGNCIRGRCRPDCASDAQCDGGATCLDVFLVGTCEADADCSENVCAPPGPDAIDDVGRCSRSGVACKDDSYCEPVLCLSGGCFAGSFCSAPLLYR